MLLVFLGIYAFIANIYISKVHELKEYWNILETLKMLMIIITVFLSCEPSSVHLERSSSASSLFVRSLVALL